MVNKLSMQHFLLWPLESWGILAFHCLFAAILHACWDRWVIRKDILLHYLLNLSQHEFSVDPDFYNSSSVWCFKHFSSGNQTFDPPSELNKIFGFNHCVGSRQQTLFGDKYLKCSCGFAPSLSCSFGGVLAHSWFALLLLMAFGNFQYPLPLDDCSSSNSLSLLRELCILYHNWACVSLQDVLRPYLSINK